MVFSNISFCGFCDAFPESRQETFSYDGKKALFEYLESFEDDTGESIELDIVALCCEYTEYQNIEEYLNDYHPDEITTFEDWKEENDLNKDYEEKDTYIEDISEEVENYLNDRTQLIKLNDNLNDGFIIADF